MKSFTSILMLLFIIVSGSAAQNKDDKSIQQPTLISSPKPVYPKEAKEAGIGGRITVRVVVDESGNPVSVDEPSGPAQLCLTGNADPRLEALRNSVVDAIKQAKFKPATKDGTPVKTTIWVNSTFDPYEKTSDPKERKVISGGVVNGKARRLPKPEYPPAAGAVGAGGGVTVQVLIDEEGKVFSAQAVSGHPLLRASAVEAACKAKFPPTTLEGKLVRVSGVLTYNFVP